MPVPRFAFRSLVVSSIFRRSPRRRLIQRATPRLETLEVRRLLSATTADGTFNVNGLAESVAELEAHPPMTMREIRRMNVDDIPHVAPNQIAELAGSRSGFRRMPLRVRQALTEDQIQALPVRRTGLQGLTDEQIAMLTTDQIQDLRPRDFRFLGADEIVLLTPDQVGALQNDRALRRIPTDVREHLTGDQVRAINVGQTGLRRLTDAQVSHLSDTQIRSLENDRDLNRLTNAQLAAREDSPVWVGNMTVAQIRDLTFREFSRLSAAQSPYLSGEQLGSIPNNWWFTRMPENVRAALSQSQIPSLNVAGIGLGSLTDSQIPALSTAQVQSIGYRDFEHLTPAQTPLLTGDQLNTLTSSWWFGRWSDPARAALTAEQVQALQVSTLGLSRLTPAQILELAIEQLITLNYREFQHLGPDQIPHLTAEQMGSIPNSWWFGRISVEARAAITPEQVRALRVEDIGLSQLTPDQIRALTPEQIRRLGYRNFQHLAADQIQHLTPEQVGTIPNHWWLGRIPEDVRAEFNGDQIRALDVYHVGLARLTGDQVAEISVAQIQRLSRHSFEYLSAEQTPHLLPEQIATIANSWWFGRMPEASRHALTGDQVRALNVSDVGISQLSDAQVAELSTAQIQSLDYRQFEHLNPEQAPLLTLEQIGSINNSWWFRRIPEDVRAAFTPEQIQALNTDAIGTHGLTSEQVAMFSAAQVQQLSYRNFEHLSPDQAPLLTAEQLASIQNRWWFERIPSEVRARLTADQVRQLRVDRIGLTGLTSEQVAELSVEQIQQLGFRQFEFLTAAQTPHLTVEQLDTIPNRWWFERMSEEGRAALTELQVQALPVGRLNLYGLTDQQVAWLADAQIETLAYRDFHRLSAEQIVVLTPEQIATVPNSWWFDDIPEEVRFSLTTEQVQALNVHNVSPKYISIRQRTELTPEQITSLGSGNLRYLNAEQIEHVTREQMASIRNRWEFHRIMPEARAPLSRDQLLAMPNHVFAQLNHQAAHSFAPDEDHGPTSGMDHDHNGHDHGTGHDMDHDNSTNHGGGMDHGGHDGGHLPHPDDPDKQHEHLAVFSLVPHEAATFVSIANGDWSDPGVWEGGVIPGEDAQVLISADTTVTFDVVQYDAMNWVRVDGTLDWDTDDDTQLYLDTLVVDGAGVLQIGTEDNPIEHGVAARIVIADAGEAIDTTRDPNQLSRGVVSHGTAEFWGEEVTPYLSLETDPRRGDTQLVLDEVPINWEVGHRLVLTGTANIWRNPQDEELEIVAINGNVVSIDADSSEDGIQGLEFHHLTPEGYDDLSVYVANMNRNVVIMSENPSEAHLRGHVMFMHNQRVNVNNVGFYGLGRTDKRNPANDAQFDEHGDLIDNTGLNQRGRYAVHFHRAGTSYDDNPGWVRGSAVVDSPGWGYVNHESYVHMHDNVAFNVQGAAFVTEFGNEIGSFHRNLSIYNLGSGDGLEDREDIFDFGHGGHGFWLQGPGVELVDNISSGARDSAINIFTTSSEAKFLAENLEDPAMAAGRDEVPVGTVPLRRVDGNITFASRSGLETWFHLTHMNDGQSFIDNHVSWNTSRGIHNPYTGRTTIRNATIVGRTDGRGLHGGTAISRNNVTNQMTYENVHIDGWRTGISVPVNRSTVIRDGYFAAETAIYIATTHDTIRTVDIDGDPEFATLTDQQLRGDEQWDIFMDGAIDLENRDLETYFSPDIVRLGTVRFNNHQVYYDKQAADFVPFTLETSPDWVPDELLGLTNTELWNQYGIAPGGTVAPEDAIRIDRINGLVGSRAEYLPELDLDSAKYTNELEDYELRYIDEDGDLVVDNATTDLAEGWNLITRQVNDQTRTFFVYGDLTAPEFSLTMSAEEMRVNPEGLQFGFVVHGRVFDDSFGDMSFRRRFNDLEERTIHTDEDGTQYIELDFTISDLAGNSTDVIVRIVLDPNAPIVPGTGQRDLPPRQVPTTLAELLEYYFLTGESLTLSE